MGPPSRIDGSARLYTTPSTVLPSHVCTATRCRPLHVTVPPTSLALPRLANVSCASPLIQRFATRQIAVASYCLPPHCFSFTAIASSIFHSYFHFFQSRHVPSALRLATSKRSDRARAPIAGWGTCTRAARACAAGRFKGQDLQLKLLKICCCCLH